MTKSKSSKTPRFLQSDCSFAMLMMQEESLHEHAFSGSLTDIHHKACPDPLWASIWTPFGQPKSVQNRSRGHLERHQVSNLDFEATESVARTWPGGCGMHPETWTLVLSYIYILESRARFARAQLSRNCSEMNSMWTKSEPKVASQANIKVPRPGKRSKIALDS